MAKHRLYCIWKSPIFRDAIQALLIHLDIVWMGCSSNLEDAASEFEKQLPDTILFELEEVDMVEGNIAEIFEICKSDKGDIRIIGISLKSNQVILYHREQRSILNQDELLQVVVNHSFGVPNDA